MLFLYHLLFILLRIHCMQIKLSDQTPTKHKIYFCNYSCNYYSYVYLYKITLIFNASIRLLPECVCIRFKWKITFFSLLLKSLNAQSKRITSTASSICKRLMSNDHYHGHHANKFGFSHCKKKKLIAGSLLTAYHNIKY